MTTKASALSPQALDFAPGLLAIQESPPPHLPRVIMYTVSVLFGVLLLWATFGNLGIIAHALPKSLQIDGIVRIGADKLAVVPGDSADKWTNES